LRASQRISSDLRGLIAPSTSDGAQHTKHDSPRAAVAGAPVQRQLAKMVPKERVEQGNDPFPALIAGDKFVAGGSYFGVRLAGLNLARARRFATKILPLGVCLAEFGRPGAERSVPFSIGPDVIRQRLKSAGISDAGEADKAWIELRDLTVLRPTPVRSGNLSLFVGLYAVPGDDLVKTLLNVMGDLGSSLGAAGLAPAVKTAEAVYGGFGALLGLDTLEPLAEALNGRALPGTGSGYLIVANVPDSALEEQNLFVKEGALRDATGKLVTDFDYCLVAIEHYSSIVEEATNLAPDLFEEFAQAVQKSLDDRDQAGYERALDSLIGRIQASTEVIETDKDRLVSGYGSLFEKRASQRFKPQTGDPGSRTRGAGAGLALSVDQEGKQLTDANRDLSVALNEIYKFMSKASARKPKNAEPETTAQLWSAVRSEAAAIQKRIKNKPKPGEVATAIARASMRAIAPV
jgi:hypothetical protein